MERTRLLDIGSGNGYFSYYLNNPFDVTCLDFSRNMLSICPLEKKIQASASLLPFKEASFEIVFCANLLHHVERPSLVISEMARVSSRYVIVLEPNRNHPLMFLFALAMKADRNIIKLSAANLKRLTEQRLQIMSLEPTGSIPPNVTPLFILPLLRHIERYMYPKFYQLLIAKKMRFKKIICLKIIGIVILVWLLWRIDIGKTAEILFKTRPLLIFCAGILMLLHVFIKFLRYQYILIQQKISSPLHKTIHFSLAAIYLSFVTPGRIGEVSKAWFIHKAEDAPLNKLIAGGILDRFFDVYALLLIAMTGLVVMNPLGKKSTTIMTALFLAGLSPLLLMMKPAQKMCIHIVEILQHKMTFLREWPRQLNEFFCEIDSLLNRKLFFEGAATLIAYAVFFASCYVMSRSLDIPLSYQKIAMFIACANILSFLPISFAGIGTREISLVFFFSQENLTSESALAFSTLVFSFTYLLFGLIGFLCFITLKSGQTDRLINSERKSQIK